MLHEYACLSVPTSLQWHPTQHPAIDGPSASLLAALLTSPDVCLHILSSCQPLDPFSVDLNRLPCLLQVG